MTHWRMPGSSTLDSDKYGDTGQRRIYHEALEKLGEDVVGHRLGNRMPIGDAAENNPPYEFVKAWLAEKAAERRRTESRRYTTILTITIISAVAAVIAALPVLKSWIR
jgi:hypothetical protein